MNKPEVSRLDRYRWAVQPVEVVSTARMKRMGRHRVGAARRRNIGELQGWKCRYCEEQGDCVLGGDGRKWHVDHMHPLSRGGDYSKENLALACATCNMRKGDMTAREFRGFMQKAAR